MRKPTILTTAAMLLMATAAFAAPQLRDLLTLQPQSRLWVEGTSSTRDFSCSAKTIDTRVEASAPGAAGAIASGQKAITTVSLTVPSAELDCRNGTMNGHMYKALKTTEHPAITFTLSSYELSSASEGTLVTLQGPLTLGGVTRPISMSARVTDEGQGVLRVVGEHELRMTEYGLKPPSLMLGTMRVNERVKVNFDLYLKN